MIDQFFMACLEKLDYFVRHYCENFCSLIPWNYNIIRTGTTCKKIPLQKSIEFGMALKYSAFFKQKTGIFLVTRSPTF